jgi:hypothetical protein
MPLFDRKRDADDLLYDRVVLEQESGERRILAPAEFQGMPLHERVGALLKKRVRFFKGDHEVAARDALKDR